MNTEQINKAARKYCEIIGKNPDEMTNGPFIAGCDVNILTTNQSIAAAKIADLDAIINAVDFALKEAE